MPAIHPQSAAGIALYCFSVFVLAILARIGWEIGGRLWAAF